MQKWSLVLGLGLASCAAVANTASKLHEGYSVGVQAAANLAFATNESYFYQSDDIKFQDFRSTDFQAIGSYGVSAAYHWVKGSGLLSLKLGVNQFSGSVKTIDSVNDTIPYNDESIGLSNKIKLRQQYNLSLQWDKAVASGVYLQSGLRFSVLDAKNELTVEDMELVGNIKEATVIQSGLRYGVGVSLGVEYFIQQHNAIDLGVSYTFYAAKKLRNYSDFYTAASGLTQYDELQNRRSQFSLLAFEAGYSYYF